MGKNLEVISVNVEKMSDKSYFPFMIKLNKLETKEIFFSTVKTLYDITTVNIIPKSEHLKDFLEDHEKDLRWQFWFCSL